MLHFGNILIGSMINPLFYTYIIDTKLKDFFGNVASDIMVARDEKLYSWLSFNTNMESSYLFHTIILGIYLIVVIMWWQTRIEPWVQTN